MRDWCKGRFIADPGYYAGRGPMLGDLNSDHLEDLWSGINANIGAEAARNFVMMVEALDDMSASAFIVSFRHYWYNKFRWDNRQQRGGDSFELSARGAALEAQGFAAIFSALGRRSSPESDRWESMSIKSPFLMRHGVAPKCDEDSNGYSGFKSFC